MSYRRAMDAIHLRLGQELAQQENLDHPAFMRDILGRDPWEDPRQAYVDAYRSLDVDWVLGIPSGESGRDAFRTESSIDLGNGARMTEWGLSGSTWRDEHPFADVEAVLAYDPLVNRPHLPFATPESGCRNLDQVRECQHMLGTSAMVSAMRYPTLFTACIQAFGWPLFMTAAASEPDRFRHTLEGFADVSRHIVDAWAAASWPLILIHDDIAMQEGLVFRPEWYRREIFPLYERILEPILQRPEVRVCFVSDGDYSAALPDLAALGFHGFFVNPNMDLESIVRVHGSDHFLVGNIDTAMLTFGHPQEIRAAVTHCAELGRRCPGYFIKAMGDLPHNIPVENLRAYFAACAEVRVTG